MTRKIFLLTESSLSSGFKVIFPFVHFHIFLIFSVNIIFIIRKIDLYQNWENYSLYLSTS